MQLFHLISIHFPSKEAVKHGNLDKEMQLLVSYKKCIFDKLTDWQKTEGRISSEKRQILTILLEHDTKKNGILTVNDHFQATDPLTDLEYQRILSISEVMESEPNVPTLQEDWKQKQRDTWFTICVGTFYILGRAS